MFKTPKTIILKKFTNDCDEHGQLLVTDVKPTAF